MPSVSAPFERASIPRRFGAGLVDLVLLYVYIILLYLASVGLNAVFPFHGAMAESYALRHLVSFTTLTLPTVLYFALMERSRWQATVGKRLLRLRVAGPGGERVSMKQVLVRNAVKFLPWEIAHLHLHLNPQVFVTGEASALGLALGVVLPMGLAAVYAGMIVVRRDGRSGYELASGTHVERATGTAATEEAVRVASLAAGWLGLALLGVASPALGQRAPAPRPTASSGYLSVGLAQHQRNLGTSSVPEARDRAAVLGFGGGVFLRRWYLGGDGTVELGRAASVEAVRARRVSGTALLNLGYALLSRRSFQVYPSVGVGGAELLLRDETPGERGASQRLHRSYLVAHAALNGAGFLGRPSRRGSLLLGWSVGYHITALHSDWQMRGESEQPLALPERIGLPEASGPMLTLRLGWGVRGW